jgi:hypothetical protein
MIQTLLKVFFTGFTFGLACVTEGAVLSLWAKPGLLSISIQAVNNPPVTNLIAALYRLLFI